MIKSPIQLNKLKYEMQRDEAIAKLALQVVAIHEKLIAKLEEVNNAINKKIGPKGDRGIQGPKGDRGDNGYSLDMNEVVSQVLSKIEKPKNGERGHDGLSPIKGIHYFTESDIKQIKDDIQSSLSKYIDEKDPESLLHIFTKKGKRLSVKHIDGLEQTLSAFSNQLGRGYLHGGGDTIKAGTGITVTINNDGTKTITGSGGFTELAATRTIDNSNKDFTFTEKPSYIVINGVWYKENTAWTWSVLTATLLAPVGLNGSIFGIK